jgi:hypothetical protein
MDSTIYSLNDLPYYGAFYFKYNNVLIRVAGYLNPLAKLCTNDFWIWFTDIENPGIRYLEFKYDDIHKYELYTKDVSTTSCVSSKIDLDMWFETEPKK